MFFGYQARGADQSHFEESPSLYYRYSLLEKKNTLSVFSEENELKVGIGDQTIFH